VPGCKCSERVRGSKVSTFGAGVIISVYQVAWCRPGAARVFIYSISVGGGTRLAGVYSRVSVWRLVWEGGFSAQRRVSVAAYCGGCPRGGCRFAVSGGGPLRTVWRPLGRLMVSLWGGPFFWYRCIAGEGGVGVARGRGRSSVTGSPCYSSSA
jgi:hypothetical protein